MGGKSRKGGGVSGKLIARLKAEQDARKGGKSEKNSKSNGILDGSKKQ